MQAALWADVVVCDRGVLDTLAYCFALFPELMRAPRVPALDAIDAFGRMYCKSYAAIFYLPEPFPNYETGDDPSVIVIR